MKKALHITAILDQPNLLEDMVEKLAYRRYDVGYSDAVVPQTLKAVDTSSTETYVSGTVALKDGKNIINMPFITCFLFTCTKGKDGFYKLGWSSSLS
ncbi:MAG: hypothetical protein H7Y42_04730 [Chitinophagaceae bacterium]|nr:hypothetical protein [Chitinophagaceae bacterium]